MAHSSQFWGRLKELRTFLGKRVSTFLIVSVFAGFFLSAVEVGFSLLIQSFLLSVGVIDAKVVHLPTWLPTGFFVNLAMLGGAAVLRGFTQWYKVYSHCMTNETFTEHLKEMVARWALLSKESHSATAITYFTDRVAAGGNFITAVQNICIYVLTISLILVYLFKFSPVLAMSSLGALLFFRFSASTNGSKN